MSDLTAPVAPTGFQSVTDEVLRKVTERIVAALEPEKVILFGSYAHGRPTSDSDVDLLIVMETEERPSQRRRRVSRLFRERPFPMDIIVRTPAEIRESVSRVDPFIHEILQRGKVLYERAGSA
jgi:predicted nucleotidyltransferase